MTGEELLSYRDREVHIVGASAAEGYAVLGYLHSRGFRRLIAHDTLQGDALRRSFFQSHVSIPPRRRAAEFRRLAELPAAFRTGPEYLAGLETAALIFAGQNWFAYPQNRPVAEAREQGIPVRFLIQLYFGLSPAPVAAVTGTNGKTTVTTLLHHILNASGVACLMGGNDRYHAQVLDRLHELPASGVLVLEVSNRQLRELEQGPHVAVLTNVQPDHLEEHGSFEAYAETKERLFRLQARGGCAVVNADDAVGARILRRCPAAPVPYSLDRCPENGAGPVPGGYGIHREGRELLLFAPEDLKLPGLHNRMNALAAAAAATVLGVPAHAVREGIRSFRGVRNRIQFIRQWQGIRFYDDLASTNPSALRVALESFARPVILIAGGDAKGQEPEYETLSPVLAARVRRMILLGGTAAECLAAAAGNVPVERMARLEPAVRRAVAIAEPGDVILLSPGGAGFYSRYMKAGGGFRKIVRELAGPSRKPSLPESADS